MNGPKHGKVHVYTGDGKGKTTAAFGLAMRASGKGLRVLILQFMKGRKDTGETVSAREMSNVAVEQYGTERFLKGDAVPEEDRTLARKGLERAREAMKSNEADMLILDELNVALHFKLLSLEEAIGLIEMKPEGMELVITGRFARPEIIARADYVTEMKSRKHPFDSGDGARSGIEF